MRIGRLASSDYEAMIDLWSKANLPFKPKGRDSKSNITAQMNAEPEFFLGAFEDENLVGAVVVSSDGRKGWINRLTTDPKRRHQGIAKALIEESENVLKNRGISIFCALVGDSNVASRKLFKRCGYIEHHDIIYLSKRDSEDT